MGSTMVKPTLRQLIAAFAEHAENVFLCALCVLCVLYSTTAFAVPPARTMYTEALAEEQTVRAALAAPDAAPDVLADVHVVVKAYEIVVARYPASGYGDNALWQAGRLSLDAFLQFGQQRDKEAALRIFRRLAAGYPT